MSAAVTATPEREQAAPPAPRPAAPPGRRDRPLLLVALLAACAYAAFANGAVALGNEAPLQIGLVVIALAALATGRAVPRAAPVAWAGVALLGAFAAWSALSLLWSVAPDLSWQSANRAAAYALVVVLALAAGTITPRAAERTALGLLALAVAVALWALRGRAFPGVVDGTALSPRLRDPLGYWNALALVCVIGMPPAIRVATDLTARPAARLGGLAALWLLIVTAALTYSRGGALALAAAVAVLVALGARRLPALAVLATAAVAAVPPVALAFGRNALAYAAPLGDRIAAGRGLAAVLFVSLLALLGAGWAALRAEGRVAWRPAWSRAIWTALAGAAVLAVVVLLATGTVSRAVHDFGRTGEAPPISTPSRLLSTNSGNRW